MVATLGRFSVSLEIWRSDLTSDLTSGMGGTSRIMYVSMYDMYDIFDAYDVDNVHDVYEMLMLKIRKCQACPRAATEVVIVVQGGALEPHQDDSYPPAIKHGGCKIPDLNGHSWGK